MSEQPPDDTAPDAIDPGSNDAGPSPIDADASGAEVPEEHPTRLQRIGRRVVRRPMNWLNSPWPVERLVQYLTAMVVLVGCTLALAKVVHLDLVFDDNTPTGGDMGAHVMGPAYLRDHLLPHWQLSGWSNYWYNGFPLYMFYMLPPALLILFFNLVVPYGVAFKIVAVLGIFALPFCCWAFGRLARFRYPIPELMAVASMVFLFDESFSIYGGNVKSTMAGEFSFSIALALAMLGLGVFARGLETGKHRNKAAILISLAMLSHGLVLLFVALAFVLLWLVWMDRTRFIYGLTVGLTAVLLASFWALPFVLNKNYMTDMKYQGKPEYSGESFWDMFFPWTTFLDIVVSGFALIGFVSSVVKRHLNGAWLGILCIALMAATYLGKDSLPVVGLLWNPRILPFLYLVRLLLMVVGIVNTAYFVAKGLRGHELRGREVWITGLATAVVVSMTVLVVQLFLFREVPGARMTTKDGKSVYAWGFLGWDPITLTATSTDALSDGWTSYNFNGYEGRPAYGEYKALIDTMAGLGETHGCGRALWEVNSANGAYGTTMALMLLPHWTDGCIASSEGLFFEASGTTPYHFITAAAMSENSSNPVRELRYVDNNAAVGVPELQKMGIQYVMVSTQAAKDQAATRGELTLVAKSGPWKIFEVAGSEVVVPLAVQPVVVNEREGDQRERHLELGTSWFQNPEEWAALPANDGPPEWQRIDVEVDLSRREGSEPGAPGRKVDIVVPVQTIEPVPLPEITVSNYHMGDQDISFDVSQVGVPVLVKVSYFPNWVVDGAEGPYHVAPNFIVVVPTSTHVRLHFERSTLDKFAYFLTFVGIGLLFVWRARGDVHHRSPHPFLTSSDGDGWGADADVAQEADGPPDESAAGPPPDEEVTGPPGGEAQVSAVDPPWPPSDPWSGDRPGSV